MKTAFLFPGQGSQAHHMMDVFTEVPVVRQTFDNAKEILNIDFWQMLQEDSEAIHQTENTQPLMLTASIAIYRAFLESGGTPPNVLAGHSLGEYSALVVANALDFADALHLVRLRAQLMQNAVPQGVGAMAAILGLDDAHVIRLCAEAAENEVVEAVNFNSPAQVVIAGNATAVNRAMTQCKDAGAKRALLLPVSVPSHCRLMKPAAEKLAEALKNIPFRQPEIPVIHNVDVLAHRDIDDIKTALVKQLHSPVRWTETIQMLAEHHVEQFAECGPGKVLAGLNKRINKSTPCSALVDMAQIQAFINPLA